MPEKLSVAEQRLKRRIVTSLRSQGFTVNPHLRLASEDRDTYRRVQHKAKMMQVSEHRGFLTDFAKHAARFCRDGAEIVPGEIDLELREVRPKSFESRMFFWWNLVWWSMPYQQAYGRQIRFIIWDRAHGAPFGLIQLQSPLLRMGARDDYLKIPRESLDYWANMSMSAQRIGAIPPYNGLIGGKMAALAVTSNEVRDAYRKKYGRSKTVMRERALKADLLFVTTTSAFGRSSMYDRLRYEGRPAAIMIGQTKGTGTFHVPDSLVRDVYSMLEGIGVDTSTSYGHGPSRKIRLLKQAFAHLGLGGFYAHGIKRDVYLFPLAENLKDVIHRGRKPAWLDRPFDAIAGYWKRRWAIPRSRRMPSWRDFDSERFMKETMVMIR